MKKLLLFISVALILAGSSGCVREKEMGLIYVSDSDNDRIVILDMSLNWVDSFAVTDPDPYSSPGGVTVNDEFIYVLVWLEGNDAVFKYNISSPYAKVDSVEVYGANDLDHDDDDYVYVCEKKQISGEWHRYVTIIKKSDMSIHDRFESFPPSVPNVNTDGIAVDDDYIYVTGYTTIRKFNKRTQELVTENASPGGVVKELGSDSTYLYATNGNGEIRIYKKSDLSLYKTITGLCVYSMDAAVAGSYVYVVDGGWDDEVKGQQVLKVETSTEEVVATFGEAGYQGSDNSHLKWPHGIAIGPEEEAQPIIALIG